MTKTTVGWIWRQMTGDGRLVDPPTSGPYYAQDTTLLREYSTQEDALAALEAVSEKYQFTTLILLCIVYVAPPA